MTESRTGRLKPHERTFTRVGVGMFRPIEVKRCRSLFKPHGVMFTCYGICAIHIAVAFSSDQDSFISALGQEVNWSQRNDSLSVTY